MGAYFFLFMCVWIYTRHYLNLRILYSLFTEYKTIGPYELDWAGGQFKCELALWITASLLSALQALNLFWLFFIVRIAYRFVFYAEAKDDRSDDEESEHEPVEGATPAESLSKKGAGVKIVVAAPDDEQTPLVGANGSTRTTRANGRAKMNGAAKSK